MIDYGIYNSKRFVVKVGQRARKGIFDRFIEVADPKERDTVLDVGVTPDNTLISNNFFEKMYPWTNRITMCTVEDGSNLEQEFPGSKFIQNEPGEPLPFHDDQFNIVFCSAVLEHVGDREAQRFFLGELIRVGRKIFLTTPNRWFPVEVHTVLPLIHWLPQPIHQKILKLLGMDFYASTDRLNLLSKRQLSIITAPNQSVTCTYSSYKLFGLTSNIILYIEK